MFIRENYPEKFIQPQDFILNQNPQEFRYLMNFISAKNLTFGMKKIKMKMKIGRFIQAKSAVIRGKGNPQDFGQIRSAQIYQCSKSAETLKSILLFHLYFFHTGLQPVTCGATLTFKLEMGQSIGIGLIKLKFGVLVSVDSSRILTGTQFFHQFEISFKVQSI